MKKCFFIFSLVVFALIGCIKSHNTDKTEARKESNKEVRYEYGLPVDSFEIDTAKVRSGETLGGILSRAGAKPSQTAMLNSLDRREFDVRLLREGKTYYTLCQRDTNDTKVLRHFVYCPSLREAYVLHFADSLTVDKYVKPLVTRRHKAEVVIESSLWNAMAGNGLPTELALELSEIYAWTIDFFGLQINDSIRVLYDEQFVDTTRIGIGRIYAAHFYHGGKWQKAYYFDTDSLSAEVMAEYNGNPIHNYFDEDGNSLKKAFLKAPLNYKRISSRFTYARKHPIYKVVRPHTGVDYAAPAGTPVVSIGDGTVIFKAYKGGGGNTVKIRHNSTYTTAYLHLQGYAKGLQVGGHVKQGQVIGYVGSTGSSTGPHLDFRIWKNGTPIDPLKMVSPPSDPIPAGLRQPFDSVAAAYSEVLCKELGEKL